MRMVSASSLELDYWLRRIVRGDRDALEELYKATSSAVYAYALSIVKNSTDAQDVTSDTFISIWHKADGYLSHGKPLAWIITIARNHALMLLRQQRRYIPLQPYHMDKVIDPEDSAMLKLCMEQLTDEERQIVVLHVTVGMTHRQIAQIMGLNISTVLSKYRRSLQKLRQNMT